MDYTDKKLQQKIRHVINDEVKLCGCGTGQNWVIVQAFLTRAAKKGHEHPEGFYDPITVDFGDEKVELPAVLTEFIAHALDGFDLLEHGSSIGNAWPSETGELLLQFLQDYGVDENGWPDWVRSCPMDEEW